MEQAKNEYLNLESWQKKWKTMQISIEELNNNCLLSGFDPYKNEFIAKIEEQLTLTEASWSLFREFY